jgi:hypothetical protein
MASSSPNCDRAAVLAQLERILSSSAFRNSKRDSNLLRHIVEQTVDGRTSDLKERTLGVEVFGRSGDYDNSADPIVRSSASELRKRIAQYYHDPRHEQELRIELPLGSYIPEFREPLTAPELPATKAEPDPVPVKESKGRRGFAYPVLLCAAVSVLGLLFWRPWIPSGALEQFWQPYLNDGSPVLVCIAPAFNPSRPDSPTGGPEAIAWPDSATSVTVASLLGNFRQPIEFRLRSRVTFEDLSNRPAVLIGAFNDAWSLRLTENLRFQFRREDNIRWVLDTTNPASRQWSSDFSSPGSPKRDFAVISRLLLGRSGKPVLVIAGLGAFGTKVAGDFVANRSSLEEMARKAPAGWRDHNLQVVLGVEVIDGHTGPANIEAIRSW